MLEKIIKYKEFILILVLFVSGSSWMYGIFATKSYVKQVRCLMTAEVEVSLYQIKFKEIEYDIRNTEEQLGSIQNTANAAVRDQLTKRLELLNALKSDTIKNIGEIASKVTSGEYLDL